METCMVRACHAPQQPLQNCPSGHLGGWAKPRSAVEVLVGHHQRADIPAQPELLTVASCREKKKKNSRGSLLNRPTCPPTPPTPQSSQSRVWTELNWAVSHFVSLGCWHTRWAVKKNYLLFLLKLCSSYVTGTSQQSSSNTHKKWAHSHFVTAFL